ncbi:hypothetical protein V1525DRAFT_398438 [Lipomyces kononenkoae]|uniref:Uncharacterized protein n=1 Tax=Lipomyces kononenkoae TaxID=34357 RepID=A0ACC3T5Q8_LIPKO
MAPPVLLDQLLHERTAALLQSATDYRRYAHHLSSRLHHLRKTLKVRRRIPAKAGKSASTTPADSAAASKYKTHVPSVTELSADKRFAGIFLLAAERAWAHAMETKVTMENNAAGAPERKRHILSRLAKARKHAAALESIVLNADSASNPFTDYEILQVVTYTALLAATGDIESRNYEKAVASFALAYTGLSGLVLALATADASDDDNDMADLYRDLISSTVEPALKFSAIQVDSSARSIAILALAHKYLPTSPVDKLVLRIAKDETKAKELLSGKSDAAEALSAIPTIQWRSHTAQLRDTVVAATILAAGAADEQLFSEVLLPSDDANKLSLREKAVRFDPALLAWQDAVDAVHEAITEVTNSSIEGAQQRVQELYIVSTYANYSLISRRIARDNVLVSQLRSALNKRHKKTSSSKLAVNKSVSAKVRATTGIYDTILQSVSQIIELPGVAADEALSNALSSLQKYYSSLRLAVAASGFSQASVDASTYWKKAVDEINCVDEMALNLDDVDNDNNARILFNVDVPGTRKSIMAGAATSQSFSETAKIVEETKLEAEQNRGSQPFVIDTLTSAAIWFDNRTGRTKFVDFERLVDLDNVASLTPVPSKPVFFDTAFNFIGYEDGIVQEATAAAPTKSGIEPEVTAPSQQDEKKTGWFWRR